MKVDKLLGLADNSCKDGVAQLILYNVTYPTQLTHNTLI